MENKILKYIFGVSAFILLIVMIFASRDAGTSCDEMLHYGQSEKVYNYFSTGGEDKSALELNDLNLRYYGQSYDNIATFASKWLGVKDVFAFRKLMSVFMGWLTIIITALFARWLRNYLTAIFVLLLFAVSPFFIGHSYNNLKDIPFAFAYIAGIWMIIRFILSTGKNRILYAILLTLSIAFSISIRAGGLILICYLFAFFIIYILLKYYENEALLNRGVVIQTLWLTGISLAAFFLSTLLWPYALQDPFRNIIESYKVMANYPATFRQLFEGQVEWSDHMPWYYLPKSMVITIPLLVSGGFLAFLALSWRTIQEKNWLYYAFILFTIIFPVIFVIIRDSNLYSSWRQFLFIYPGIVILSATGIAFLFEYFKIPSFRIALIIVVFLVIIHPLKFMLKNHPYEYIYYNELTGGVKGAFARYELDYYYTSETEAAEWLKDHLKNSNIAGPMKIASTYSVSRYFTGFPGIETLWIRYEERSMNDWDYAIIVNRYIPPYQLKNKIWPPENSIHTIYVDEVPVCAILERRTKDDYLGYMALNEKRYGEASGYLNRALNINDSDEMIFYNFAGALYNTGEYSKADSVLKEGLKLNPGSELILMYLGNIAASNGDLNNAEDYYRRVIESNRKYFEAYIRLAGIISGTDIKEARKLLRECITLNPRYCNAIIALGDTYRESNPEIAEKYYEQAKNINQP